MDIDPHTLPEEASLLRQIVLQLLGVVEEKDRLLERVQHQLKQLLRQRYGQKRERIDENQLFLFAAQIIAASQASAASARPEPPATGSAANTSSQETKQRNGHGRKPLPASLERRRVLFDLDETQRQCPHCRWERQRIGKTSANGWSSFRSRCTGSKKFVRSTPVPRDVAWPRFRNR